MLMDKLDYWKSVYEAGRRQLYPWDCVVSFVFRHAPRDRKRSDVHILEVGCGTASNLWFAAREGFTVAGIERDATAVDFAANRFAADGLAGDLRVGSFVELPFSDASFDLVIDRGSLTCAAMADIALAVKEVERVIKPNGHFFMNVYADSHTSARSGPTPDFTTVYEPTTGSIAGIDQLSFLSRAQVLDLLRPNWEIRSLQRLELIDMYPPASDIHSEWRAIARRTSQ
jgi:SAM-dependent methyltransferase